MNSKNRLYLQGSKINDNQYRLSLESFIIVFVLKSINFIANFEINLIDDPVDVGISINIPNSLFKINNFDKISSSCELPILYDGCNTVIAGLCGVCRGIIKLSILINNKITFCEELLGFKAACLLSPTECSVWTKFCEIDVIVCTKLFISGFEGTEVLLPNEILKFESHMSQPIRTHNVYKLARNLQNNKSIKSNIPIEELNIDHEFAESHKITLADIILFPCYSLMFDAIGDENLLGLSIPLTKKWFATIKNYSNNLLVDIYDEIIIKDTFKSLSKVDFLMNEIENYSLYKSDPKRYKPRNRIFTKQIDLDSSFSKLENIQFPVSSLTSQTPGREIDFDWKNIPYDGLPEGGKLPLKRLTRKKEQLENLAREIIAISKDDDVIVDFCSGTGHLGIILACKLPNCKIILVENKEESLKIAKQRSEKLKLTNISFFQCNLDYFTGTFNTGTSLHACGVATDIVLQLCFKSNANFVCSPCCYGKILEMPHIKYPRSVIFRDYLKYNDYLFIAHCADQTHDVDSAKVNVEKSLQGEYCMDVIDTDRIMQAKELEYNVILTRMIPEKCSLKNRLLIGFK